MQVEIVIPAVEWSQRLERCLESLKTSGVPFDQITVVFDGAPAVPSQVTSQPGLKAATTDRRRGYGAACNTGFRTAASAGCDVVVFLNDDVEMPKGWQKALESLSESHIGAVGFTVRGPAGERRRYPAHAHESARQHYGPTLAGSAFAVRCDTFRQLGGFDESFGMYGEETDLFARMQRIGKSLVESPIEIWHEGEGTMGSQRLRKSWYAMRNPLLFSAKNETLARFLRAIAVLLAQVLLPLSSSTPEPHIARKRALPLVFRLPLALAAIVAALVRVPSMMTRRGAKGDLRP